MCSVALNEYPENDGAGGKFFGVCTMHVGVAQLRDGAPLPRLSVERLRIFFSNSKNFDRMARESDPDETRTLEEIMVKARDRLTKSRVLHPGLVSQVEYVTIFRYERVAACPLTALTCANLAL